MKTDRWTYQIQFLLECVDALTEARQRSGFNGPVFSLRTLVQSCQTQGPLTPPAFPAEALALGLLDAGWVIQDEHLGQPRLTQAGQDILSRLREPDSSGQGGAAHGQVANLRTDLLAAGQLRLG